MTTKTQPKFNPEAYEQLLQGGGRTVANKLKTLMVHLQKLNGMKAAGGEQRFFDNTQVAQNHAEILVKAEQSLRETVETMKTLSGSSVQSCEDHVLQHTRLTIQ